MEETEKEVKDINKQNNELRKQLEETENFWNETIENLSKKLNKPLKEAIDLQAEAISIRQILTEQIKSMSYNTYKFKQKVKVFEKERLEYYILQYPGKTNFGEKSKMVEADLAAYQYRIDIFDIHINFLRETQKDVDNVGYFIKNKVQLYNLTEME